MSRIIIAMLPELGHLLPTLCLADGLRSRGHAVSFLTVPDLQGWAARHGFNAHTAFESVFPVGSLEAGAGLTPTEALERKHLTFKAMVDYVNGDGLLRALTDARPDLVLADSLNDTVIAAARMLSIPVIRLSTSLPQRAAPGVAPLSCELPLAHDRDSRQAVERAWQQLTAERSRPGSYHAEKRRILCERFSYPVDEISERGAFEAELFTVPEISLAPAGFDFPRPAADRPVYGESLWLDRPEVGFPTERLDGRPLVYAALGSQQHRIGAALAFQRCVHQVARSMRERQFVLVTPEPSSDAPPNVVEARHAPQLELISRSEAVVCHGGLGTLKECFFFGKPVIVLPDAFDQPGNAARVRHYGLGLTGALSSLSAPWLGDAIAQLSRDQTVRAQVASIRAEIVSQQERRPALAFVEHLLARALGRPWPASAR